jgi:hypothetical protein
MFTTDDIFWLLAVPAAIALGAILGTRPWRRNVDLGGWGAAVAILGGFAVAFVHSFGFPTFPPIAAQGWLFYLTVPALIVALVQIGVRNRSFAIASAAIVLLAMPFLILRRVTYVEARELWTWIGASAVGAVAWWYAMDALARRVRGASLPLLLSVVTGVAGLAVINAHSQLLGQVTGSLAIPLLIVALAGGRSRGTSLTGGGMLALTVTFLGMLLCARFFADLTTRDLVLLAVAPLAAWAGELPGLGKSDSWKRVAVRTVVVLIVLALPAVTAAKGLAETLHEQTDSYSY